MAWCAKCTCCEVRSVGDLCIFCEDNLICPRQRNKERLAKTAAEVLARRRVKEDRVIRRKAARAAEKRAARRRADAHKKLERASDRFIASVVAVEIPADERTPA